MPEVKTVPGLVKTVKFDAEAEERRVAARSKVHVCQTPTEAESVELGSGTVWRCPNEDCGHEKMLVSNGAAFVGWRNTYEYPKSQGL